MDAFSLSISFGYFDGHMSLIWNQLPNIVFSVFSSFTEYDLILYHRNFNMNNMRGATNRAGTAYPSPGP